MDVITQATAANAEESASLAQALNTQARGLETSVTELATLVHGSQRHSDLEPEAEGQRSTVKASGREKPRHSKLPALNCWEFKKCGREAGGAKASALGVCPAYPHHGRQCAEIVGTLCGGKLQGTFASKIANCMKCDFYQSGYYCGNQSETVAGRLSTADRNCQPLGGFTQAGAFLAQKDREMPKHTAATTLYE